MMALVLDTFTESLLSLDQHVIADSSGLTAQIASSRVSTIIIHVQSSAYSTREDAKTAFNE